MFQGAFNRAMGMATAGIMGAGKLLSGKGVPDVQKELEAQKQLTQRYQYELGKILDQRKRAQEKASQKWKSMTHEERIAARRKK